MDHLVEKLPPGRLDVFVGRWGRVATGYTDTLNSADFALFNRLPHSPMRLVESALKADHHGFVETSDGSLTRSNTFQAQIDRFLTNNSLVCPD